MKYLLVLLVTLFSGSLFADVITDAKLVMQTLSGKNLSNTQMLSIATKYAAANDYRNPWVARSNPVEYAAWPTATDLATFFLTNLRKEIREDLSEMGSDAETAALDAAIAAARQAAADEL